jgi:Tfp pilus assembly protein PilV
MTPTGRRTPPAEEGFALIEVLVSALVLAIVAAGVLALLQATTRSAAAERSHAEAYAISQEDQARLRSLRLSALNRLEETRTVTVDGNQFTVKSQGAFINNVKRQPSSCTTGETSADYVQITTTTSYPEGHQPVVLQSIISPSNGSLDPNHGTLLVTTKNAAGNPLGGVGLSGTGPGNFSGTSDSTGCANFSDLPAGNYEVTASGTGLVGKDGLAPHAETQGVSAGSTTTLALQYDYGATMQVEFEYRVGSGSTYSPATIDSVYFANSLGSAAYWTPTKTARETSIKATPLYPFPAADSIWAGSCKGNNPGTGAAMGTYTFQPGEVVTTPLKLKVPALELTVKNGAALVKGATITITDENCNDSSGQPLTRTYMSETNGHQSVSSTGQPEYGLPFGTYKICASASYSGTLHRVRETGVSVQSLTSTTSRILSLPSSGSETGSGKTCP